METVAWKMQQEQQPQRKPQASSSSLMGSIYYLLSGYLKDLRESQQEELVSFMFSRLRLNSAQTSAHSEVWAWG